MDSIRHRARFTWSYFPTRSHFSTQWWWSILYGQYQVPTTISTSGEKSSQFSIVVFEEWVHSGSFFSNQRLVKGWVRRCYKGGWERWCQKVHDKLWVDSSKDGLESVWNGDIFVSKTGCWTRCGQGVRDQRNGITFNCATLLSEASWDNNRSFKLCLSRSKTPVTNVHCIRPSWRFTMPGVKSMREGVERVGWVGVCWKEER